MERRAHRRRRSASTLNVRVTTAQPAWSRSGRLSGNGNDIIGPHDGALMGTGVNFLIAPVASDCGNQTDTALCLDDRFQVTARYRVGPQTNDEGVGHDHQLRRSRCATNSGIFWFFQDNNWELMVKALNGCGYQQPLVAVQRRPHQPVLPPGGDRRHQGRKQDLLQLSGAAGAGDHRHLGLRHLSMTGFERLFKIKPAPSPPPWRWP